MTQLDTFIERITKLGATADEVAEVRARWDDFDDDWTPDTRAALLSWPDSKLRAEMLLSRAEFAESTQSDDERAEADAAARAADFDSAVAEVSDIIGLAVPKIIEWVGGDPLRAEAALSVERQASDPRKTLVEPLEALLGEQASEGDGSES